jgi:ATP-dependent RNA helicase RhlE
VGRGKKKQLLAHIIQQHDWSQVLVFTRTKFGANNVAEFLNKNGVTAMALHGNKSQGARTQALAGFKSGEIRALVATDIAARGIDIDDLPHVVNYEIPNVPEDYVHRIGRTGRAGREGQAVSLVCLDEEGFMQEIERFTKQQIPAKVVEGFGPEPGERAEPIAMGRQTLWGGAGKPPSRDVMAAAAKAARQEMMQRIRDNKGESGGKGRGAGNGESRSARAGNANGNGGANGNGQGRGRSQGPRPVNGANGNGQRPPQQVRPQQRPPQQARAPQNDRDFDDDRDDSNDSLPRNVDPLRTSLPSRRDMTGVRRPASGGNAGQPDPMRTSIDSMGAGARRGGGGGGGGGNRNRGGGGGGGYGARGNNQNRKYGS